MFRAEVRGKRNLHRHMVQQQMEAHQSRLRNIRPSIDNKPPPQFRHLRANPKRAQLEEERYAEIEKHNRMLLSRMETIMRKGNTLDNRAEKHTEVRSLNFSRRKQELMRITQENLQILKRIQHQEPSYSSAQWENDARRHERILRNMCEYPVQQQPQQQQGMQPSRSGSVGANTSAVNRSGRSGRANANDEQMEDVRQRARAAIAAAREAVNNGDDDDDEADAEFARGGDGHDENDVDGGDR